MIEQRIRMLIRGGLALAFAATPVFAQTTSFSIDYKAQTVSDNDSATSAQITEGDILQPGTPGGVPALAPLPTPAIAITSGAAGLGLFGDAINRGHTEGVHVALEVDALSFGVDGPAVQNTPPGTFWFSVDKFAVGVNTGVLPDVFSEGADFMRPGALDAGADVFTDLGLPMAPVCPTAGVFGNVGAIDGNGANSTNGYAYPGVGLIEPNPLVPMFPPADDGDNLDAVDIDELGLSGNVVYFSLDAGFNNPIGLTGSAAANGFVGGDVLVTTPGSGAIAIYAPAPMLGLDPMGLDVDDIDALAVWDNGDGVFQPSMTPYDWLGGGHDMVLFSVRAGSAIVGVPASNCAGMPIEPGDILTAPLGGAPLPPAIFIAAEALGLQTFRTHGTIEPDDLDALDVLVAPLFDCESNGTEDAIDIVNGTWTDTNRNGIPDRCEILTYCVGKLNSELCVPFVSTNGYPSTTSTAAFQVVSNDIVRGEIGFYVYGSQKANLNFFGGKLCVKSPLRRWYPVKAANTKATSTCTTPDGMAGKLTRDFNSLIQSGNDPSLSSGRTVTMQLWQRDPQDPAGFGIGLTDAVRFVIQP